MSLLLNALKKAEEGDKSADAADDTTAATTAAGVDAGGDAAPAASGAGAPTIKAGQETEAPAAGATAAQPLDFDSIIDETEQAQAEKPESQAPDHVEARKRVDAARVFRAQERDGVGAGASGGGGLAKLLYSVTGVAVVGFGGYWVVASGFIPGLDIRAIESILGSQQVEQFVETTEAGNNIGAQLQVATDVVLLPEPDVDVQSEVDFAALRLPENSRNAVGEDQYIRQIAFLTGFDINKERTRSLEEQKQLLLDLEIERDNSAEVELAPPAEEEEAEDEAIIYTADLSRQAKMVLESSTPSDSELRAAVVQNNPGQQAAEETRKVAQIDVRTSAEGSERQRLIAEARALYNRGDYLEAEAVYRSVLVNAPANLNALRGVAQIALVTGRYQSAVAAYLDLLGYYPNDPVAIAELTNLRGVSGGGGYYEIEKALNNALGKIPSVDARLYFSLGNLHAQNGYWVKAQKAYFDAFSRETSNPDYAYNLAVVLDYLNKQQLAVRYYQEALRLAENTPAGFNRAAAEARVRDLN